MEIMILVIAVLSWLPSCNGYFLAYAIPVEVIFLIYLILPAALGPGVYTASNRNEY
jgi:hypothetical protein